MWHKIIIIIIRFGWFDECLNEYFWFFFPWKFTLCAYVLYTRFCTFVVTTFSFIIGQIHSKFERSLFFFSLFFFFRKKYFDNIYDILFFCIVCNFIWCVLICRKCVKWFTFAINTFIRKFLILINDGPDPLVVLRTLNCSLACGQKENIAPSEMITFSVQSAYVILWFDAIETSSTALSHTWFGY